MSYLKEYQHLQIPLKDIKSATNNFGDNNCIGRGGFGKVYRGELVISEKLTMVAMKRLNTALGQGAGEFWREIMLLSQYKHENLVSLLGFCAEEGENILVYEFLPNKSLDLYLSSPDLSWNQRLRICIDAAHGLEYLHEPAQGSQQRVLHRDIKSANILLDENWKAKIADFGLSKYGPANQQFTYQFTGAVGTPGYCDPLYVEDYFLTKESDIYSFGAVLFEVLCGRQCVMMKYNDERRLLTKLAQKCYDQKRLDTIISTSVKEKISPECLERFSKIAYQCLKRERTERPSMAKIVKELEIALEYQEFDSAEFWGKKLPTNLDAIIEMFKIPHAIYSIKRELFSFLHTGCLFDDDKQFFWINDDGKKCVLISPAKFLVTNPEKDAKLSRITYSRFSKMAIYDYEKFRNVKCQIQTSMLSLGTLYTASLLFKCVGYTGIKKTKIKWKTGELSVCSTHNAIPTEEYLYSIKMWQFINDRPDAVFDIVLEELSLLKERYELIPYDLKILGFEFMPVEMHEELQSLDEVDMDNDDEEYWEKMLPDDYPRFIQKSIKPLDYNSKKELYLCLCDGFLGLLGESRPWFFLCKSTRQICSMLPATDIEYYDLGTKHRVDTITLSESRLHKVIKIIVVDSVYIKCRLESPMFSPHYIYACYLVFKFQDNQTQVDDAVLFEASCSLDGTTQGAISIHMNLYPFNIPTTKPTNVYGSHESSSLPANERLDQMHKHQIPPGCSKVEERKDGWMEVMLCKPLRHLQDHKSLKVELSRNVNGVFGLICKMIIEGIEFRPFSVE